MIKKKEMPSELKIKTDQEIRVYVTMHKGEYRINFQQDLMGVSARLDYTQAKRLCDWFYSAQEFLTPDTKTESRKKESTKDAATSV